MPGSVAQPIAFTIRPTDKPYSVFCYFSGDVSNNAVVTITDVTQLPGTVVTTFNYLPYAQGYTLPVPIAGTPAHTYNVSTTFDNLASPTVSYDNVDNEGAGISNLSCNGGMVRCEYSKFVMGAGYSVLVTVVDQTIYNN
ncbi:MAG TPA: hypothetical protein VEW28_04250 [Candidatus Kapabacteria bacterium]|nr:hypothetical protein [Candidatus Kapabacteria bacterium]